MKARQPYTGEGQPPLPGPTSHSDGRSEPVNLSTTLPPTRSCRRPRALGVALAGMLVLAMAAVASTPAPAAAQDCTTLAPLNQCIPGGANSRLDCMMEWLTVAETAHQLQGHPQAEDRLPRGRSRRATRIPTSPTVSAPSA